MHVVCLTGEFNYVIIIELSNGNDYVQLFKLKDAVVQNMKLQKTPVMCIKTNYLMGNTLPNEVEC
jgi:hypothetical protein